METARKTADRRLKDLRLALLRIQKGRSQTGASKVTVRAVATEAGVSNSLIYNHYPSFLKEIEAATGKVAREQRDAKHQELKDEQATNRRLRAELKLAQDRIAKIASINEALASDNELLRARIASPKIIPLRSK